MRVLTGIIKLNDFIPSWVAMISQLPRWWMKFSITWGWCWGGGGGRKKVTQCYSHTADKQMNPSKGSVFAVNFCRHRGRGAGMKGSHSKNNIAGEVAHCVLTDWSDRRRRRRRSPLTDTQGGAEVSRNLGEMGAQLRFRGELVSLLPHVI